MIRKTLDFMNKKHLQSPKKLQNRRIFFLICSFSALKLQEWVLVVWRHGGSLVLAPYAAETRVGLQPQTSDDSVTLQKRSWREDRSVEWGQELTRSLIRDDWERRSEKSMAVSGRGTMPVNKSSATKMMCFSLYITGGGNLTAHRYSVI